MIMRSLIGVLTIAAALATATAASAGDESKYPDWSGQWRWNAMGGAPRYDPSKPAGVAQEAPLKEEFRRIHQENLAEQARGGAGLYAQSTKCIPMGMPFQMSIVPFPLEFVITEKTTFIFSTHDAKVMSYANTIVRLADGKLAAPSETPAGAQRAGAPA